MFKLRAFLQSCALSNWIYFRFRCGTGKLKCHRFLTTFCVSPRSKLCTTLLKIAKHFQTVAVRLRLIFQFTYVQYCIYRLFLSCAEIEKCVFFRCPHVTKRPGSNQTPHRWRGVWPDHVICPSISQVFPDDVTYVVGAIVDEKIACLSCHLRNKRCVFEYCGGIPFPFDNGITQIEPV